MTVVSVACTNAAARSLSRSMSKTVSSGPLDGTDLRDFDMFENPNGQRSDDDQNGTGMKLGDNQSDQDSSEQVSL